jgi:hypothetical protein
VPSASNRGAGFHFHNFYLSNAVEIGIVGAGMQTVLMVVLGLSRSGLRWASRRLPGGQLLAMTVMVLSVTPLEVPAFFPFNLQTFILVATLVYARDGLRCGGRPVGSAAGVRGSLSTASRGRGAPGKLVAQDPARDGPTLPGGCSASAIAAPNPPSAFAVEAGAVQVARAKAVGAAAHRGASGMPGRQQREMAAPPPRASRGEVLGSCRPLSEPPRTWAT